MEVKINKEIRGYKENIYFGLSVRQFIFSALACAVAVLLYIVFKKAVNSEVASWICMLGAFPFAFIGFFSYNGMPAERFILAWIRSEILVPKRLTFYGKNYYYGLLQRKGEVDESVKETKE